GGCSIAGWASPVPRRCPAAGPLPRLDVRHGVRLPVRCASYLLGARPASYVWCTGSRRRGRVRSASRPSPARRVRAVHGAVQGAVRGVTARARTATGTPGPADDRGRPVKRSEPAVRPGTVVGVLAAAGIVAALMHTLVVPFVGE